MSDEIIKVLDALAEKFGIAVDWTSVNVVPYIELLSQKYVNYRLVTNATMLIIGIAMLIMSRKLFQKAIRYGKKYEETKDTLYDCYSFMSGVGCVLIGLIGIPVVLCNMLDLITCLTFPEKLIYEEFTRLYKSIG